MIYVKRAMAVCAAIALSATSTSLVAFAQEQTQKEGMVQFTLKAVDADGNAITDIEVGDTFYLTADITQNTGLNFFKIGIDYDEGFEVENIETSMYGKKKFADVVASDTDVKPILLNWNLDGYTYAEILGQNNVPTGINPKTAYPFSELTGGEKDHLAVITLKATDALAAGNHDFTLNITEDPFKSTGEKPVAGPNVYLNYSFQDTSVNLKKEAPAVQVEDIVIAQDSQSITIKEGDTKQINASVSPGNATNKTITYRSLDTTKAKVDKNGVVTGVKAGQTKIELTAGDVTKYVDVTVNPIPVNGIDLTKKEFTLDKDKTATLDVTFDPANSSNKEVTFVSTNEEVATVDANGKITAVGVGTTTITVTSVDNANAKVTATVNVPAVNTTKIEENDNTFDIIEGQEDDLPVVVNTEDELKVEVRDQSGDPIEDDSVVVTYNKDSKTFHVVANKPTEQPVTVVVKDSNDDVVAEFKIDAAEKTPVTEVMFDDAKMTVRAGTTLTLHAQTNSDATVKDVTYSIYSSTREGIATIDAKTGEFTLSKDAKRGDKVIVRATAVDDDTKFAECEITAAKSTVKVDFAENPVDVKVGSSKKLELVFSSDDEEMDQEELSKINDINGWTFESSDPEFVEVKKGGIIKGKKQGTVTIKATNPNYVDDLTGEKIVVTCVVKAQSVFPAYSTPTANPSNDPVSRSKINGYVTTVPDSSSSAGPVAATGGDMDTESSNAPAAAAAALGAIALGFVVVARKKRHS